MQYTIRGVPDTLDAALRERARAAGKSLNEVTIETLAEGVGVTGTLRKRRNASHIAGTWKEDKAFDEAIADQDRIDEDLWK
jgi:plasmid stability protein